MQGIGAQVEKIIIHADVFDGDDLPQNGGNGCFRFGAGCDPTSRCGHRGGRGLRQRLEVDLAVGGQGQVIQKHLPGRYGVFRQLLFQVPLEFLSGDGLPGLGHHVGDQAFFPSVVPQCQHHRIAYPRLGFERRLDLAQFDAVAADLDLKIFPPQKFDVAAGQIAPQVAGAIEPLGRFADG